MSNSQRDHLLRTLIRLTLFTKIRIPRVPKWPAWLLHDAFHDPYPRTYPRAYPRARLAAGIFDI